VRCSTLQEWRVHVKVRRSFSSDRIAMQLAGVFGGLFEHQFGMRSALEKLAGPRKVLFGSDGPRLHPGNRIPQDQDAVASS